MKFFTTHNDSKILTMCDSFSVLGIRISTLSQVNSDTSLLWENSRWATHCNLNNNSDIIKGKGFN